MSKTEKEKLAAADTKEDEDKLKSKKSEDKPEDKKDNLEKEKDEVCPDCGKPKDECKCAHKTGMPQEEAVAGQSEGHTTTTAPVIGGSQNVFVPQSSITVSPEQNIPMGKAVTLEDLQKSPLFNEVSKGFTILSERVESMKKALDSKLQSVEQVYTARLDNYSKELEKAQAAFEKFMAQPVRKALNTDSPITEKSDSKSSLSKELKSARYA
jgi:hypothetical protein